MKGINTKINEYKRIENLMYEATDKMHSFLGIDEDLFWQFEKEADSHSETLKRLFSEMMIENNLTINQLLEKLN